MLLKEKRNLKLPLFFFNFIEMKKWLFVCLVCFGFGGYLRAQTSCGTQRYQDSIFHSVTVTSGVYFATANPFGLNPSQDMYLDFYEPTGDTLKKRPLIIFQHGGSFISGTRDQSPIPGYATYFAKCGYVVASIDYRLGFDPASTGSAERAVYRAIQDLRASVRFLCQHAMQYGVDTNSVILTGTSAGCISGICSAFITEQQFPAAIHGTLTETSDLGGIDASGNTDFGNRYVKPIAIISHWGAILDTTYITVSDSIPLLAIQGTSDPVVPYITGHPYNYPVFPEVYGSLPITMRMSNLHIRNKLVPLFGLGHEPERAIPAVCDTMDNEGREFLWRILKPLNHALAGPDTVCLNNLAVYSVASTAGVKYCWQLNNHGTIVSDSGYSISVLWSDTGKVSVSVTEINYMDAQADPVHFQTYVKPLARASFTYSIYQQHASFNNTSHYANSFAWNFGNGDSSNFKAPIENFLPGTYTVTLIAKDTICGSVDTATSTIVIDSCPVAGFAYHVSGINAFFYADSTNTNSYNWNFGDGNVENSAAANVLHQYAHSGSYAVSLNVQNNKGCSNSDTVLISVLNAGIGQVLSDEPEVNCNLQYGCSIHMTVTARWNLEVYNVLGQRVGAHEIDSDYLLNASEFIPGIYFIKLYKGSETVVSKFIKQ